MLKKIILIIGIILTFIGSVQGLNYMLHHYPLTEFDKGIITGAMIWIVVGVLMIIFGSRKKRR